MKERGIVIGDTEIVGLVHTLTQQRQTNSQLVDKRPAELRSEAKRKLIERRAIELAPRFSLYALRHSWATRALEHGVDALTVGILMGHKDPSMVARVYQHLSLNPKHLLSELKRVAS